MLGLVSFNLSYSKHGDKRARRQCMLGLDSFNLSYSKHGD